MGLFGKGKGGGDSVSQDCGSCEGRGWNEKEKTDSNGNTVKTHERCSTCQGSGQRSGGSR